MHFDALMPSKHVDGDVTELATGESQRHEMDVTSDDSTIGCTLANQPPSAHGPTNPVTISWASPSGTATTSTAVISSNG
jgi:hypothetical protein